MARKVEIELSTGQADTSGLKKMAEEARNLRDAMTEAQKKLEQIGSYKVAGGETGLRHPGDRSRTYWGQTYGIAQGDMTDPDAAGFSRYNRQFLGGSPLPGYYRGAMQTSRAGFLGRFHAKQAGLATEGVEEASAEDFEKYATSAQKKEAALERVNKRVTDHIKSLKEAAAADRAFASSSEAVAAALDAKAAAAEKANALGEGGGGGGGGKSGSFVGHQLYGLMRSMLGVGLGGSTIYGLLRSSDMMLSGATTGGPLGGGMFGFGQNQMSFGRAQEATAWKLAHSLPGGRTLGASGALDVMMGAGEFDNFRRSWGGKAGEFLTRTGLVGGPIASISRNLRAILGSKASSTMSMEVMLKNLQLSQMAVGHESARLGLTRGFQSQQFGLEAEQAGFGAGTGIGLTGIGKRLGIATEVQQGLAAALGIKGTMGFGRYESQQERMTQARFAGGMQSLVWSEHEALAEVEAQREAARRQYLQRSETLGGLTNQREKAEANLQTAFKRYQKSSSTADLGRMTDAQTAVATATERVRDAQERVNESLEQYKKLSEETAHTKLQFGRDTVQQLTEERDRVQSIATMEKQRIQNMESSFGLRPRLEQARALMLARAIRGGKKEFSEREISFMQGVEEFKPALQQIGKYRAGSVHQQLVETLGLTERGTEAQARAVELNHKIEIAITENEALVTQISKAVATQLEQQRALTQQALTTASAQQLTQQRQQRDALVQAAGS